MTPRAAAALVVVLGACAAPALSANDAERVAVHALEAAGLDVAPPAEARREEVDLAGVDDLGQPRRGEVWMVDVDVDGEPWRVGVDPGAGRVVRTFEPAGAELTESQVEALASYREHPEADRAARRRRATAVAVGAGLLAATYLVLRTMARRSTADRA